MPFSIEATPEFLSEAKKLAKKYPVILKVRNSGLMVGVDLSKPGKELVNGCLDAGLVINCTHDTILRWIPAMTVSKNEIDEAIKIFEKVLLKWA